MRGVCPTINCSQLNAHMPLTKVYNSTNYQWFFQINHGLLIPKGQSRVVQFDLLYPKQWSWLLFDISDISEWLGNVHNNDNIKYLLSTYYVRDMLNIHMLSHLSSS